MSRHRNIRSMDYSEEYDGYHDVYGHSVEDDYCMSPSDAAFMYNRDNPQKIGSFLHTQKDIAEEDEGELNDEQLNADKLRLEECLTQMKLTLGPATPRQEMVDAAIANGYNADLAAKTILSKREKGPNPSRKLTFQIPKLGPVKSKESLSDLVSAHLSVSLKISDPCDSLNALASSHLGKRTFNTRPFGTKPLFPKKETAVPAESKSEIDLRRSLKNSEVDLSKSLRKLQVDDSETEFVPKFIDYNEPYVQIPQPKLECVLDVKSRAICKISLGKSPSRFAKALCRKYAKTIQYFPVQEKYTGRRFHFSVPSPDDIISLHLKKK